MEPEKTPAHEARAGNSHLTLGLTFAAGVILFVLAGIAIDRKLGVTPLFTLIGALVGMTLSFLNVYWKLTAETEQRRKDKAKP